MNFNNKILVLITLVSLAIASCKKEKTQPIFDDKNLAPLSIEFDHIVAGQKLYINTGNYINTSGEPYSISLLQYFVSNITVSKADGTVYVVPQDSSYFLIKEETGVIAKAQVYVPEGDYSSITFTVGVDSLRSTMDITRRTGVLDPTGGMDDGMYWGWNSGYIFFKMEGLSTAAPLDPSGQNKFRFHIGGFGGYSAPTVNNLKTITINLSERGVAMVRKGRNSNVHLLVDIGKVMDGTKNIKIEENPTVMFSDFSKQIAENYTQMFVHDHTEND